MAGAKNHDYHILPPSFWPLLGAFSALAMAAGGIMWMHGGHQHDRSEEHTSELQSLMRNSYAVFCLKKKNNCTLYASYIRHHSTTTHSKSPSRTAYHQRSRTYIEPQAPA